MRLAALAFSSLLVLAACGGGGGGAERTPVLPVAFDLANFSGAAIDNPFLPLVPGTRRVYEGTTAEGLEGVVVEVTYQTKVILGVTCVEVHDVVTLDGEVIEDTLDWFAQDDDGNVWYFGEDSKEIENGVVVSTEGSWQAGVDDAQAGIAMLAAPAVGITYSQEFYEDEAEDMATVVGLGEDVDVPAGSFAGCLHTEDFTPLEPGNVEDKFYAPGVGTVLEVGADGERIELVAVETF
jgi:hypothetical protein